MRRKTNLKTALVMSLFLLAIVSTAGAEIIYVDASVSPGGNGQTWGTAYKYLQDALNKPPASGDQIWVAEGTYKPDASISVVEDLVTTGLSMPFGIALDVAGGKMYWTDYGTDKVQRANMDGSNVEDLLTGLSNPVGIGLDVAGSKMYFIENGTGKIQHANLDGSGVEDLVTGLDWPQGIALDVAGGKMYWTDAYTKKVQRANVSDGGNVEDLVTTGLSVPYSIALDVAGGKMYWADAGTDKIQRANMSDGGNVEDLVTTVLSIPYSIALDVDAGKMYWTDSGTDKIQRANMSDGSSVEDLVTTGLSYPTGIALDVDAGKMYWMDYGTDKIQRANMFGGSGDRTATFQLINDVAIYGGFPSGGGDWNSREPNAHETILSGDLNGDDGPDFVNNDENSYHVVTGSRTDETAILDGFTITGGNANGFGQYDYGGGMYNSYNSSPTVTNCTFSGNSAERGGGMCNYGNTSSPTVVNCTFSGNSADYGGGGMYNYSGSPTVTNCTFSGNSASESGGGMENYQDSSPTVTNCTFSGNRAQHGGGMYNSFFSRPTVTDCTFSGNSAERGGGMYNSSSSPTVTNCTFSGNEANSVYGDAYGGGMYNYHSSPTVSKCTFSGNIAYWLNHSSFGGGMFNEGVSPTVTNCTFSGNSAYSGGGMYNKQSDPTVTNCTFSGNNGSGMGNRDNSSPMVTNCTFSGNNGSGMGNWDNSSPTVTNCTFSGNNGSGMSNDSSSPTLINCTFSGNSATWYGGGMSNDSSSPTLTNCTFSGNSANRDGGGMYNDGSNPALNNCILWGNSDSEGMDESAQIYNVSSTPTVNYSCVQGWSGSLGGWGNIGDDPNFVDPNGPDGIVGTEDDNVRLSADSPCIDAGDNTAVPPDTADLDEDGNTSELTPLDLDGLDRFIDDPNTSDTGVIIFRPVYCPENVDMGAYEFGSITPQLRLVAHWKLDERDGNIAYDSSGNNHGTLYGEPNWQPGGGQIAGALEFDDVDDYVDCGNDASLNLTDEITLAVWVNTEDAGNSEHNPYVMKGDHSYAIKHHFSNSIEFFIYDGGWHVAWFAVDNSFNGTWHHLAGTYDGSELKLYIDGRLEAATPYVGSIDSSTFNVNIGRNTEVTGRLYEGTIDDVRLYNYALSSDEVRWLLCDRPPRGDLNRDCKVDFVDFAILASSWLDCGLMVEELCGQ